MKDLFRTALTSATVVGLTTALAPPIALLSFCDRELPDPLIRFWVKSILRSAGVRTVATGLEHVPRAGNFVLAMNHQSHFDALVLLAHVHRHLRFVAKRELFDIPVFGQALRATGNLPVDRAGSQRDRETLKEAVTALKERTSVVFFAEGTRSDDGLLRPFKKGAAVLAIQAHVPLLPAAVAGTREILPKGSAFLRGGCAAALCIGEPLPTAGLTFDHRDELTEGAPAHVARLLDQANALLRAAR